uniref:DM2 domain-containing protein n=1 Tax=viral metagenome TaxID=1070528 RepID=A0A6C0KTQ5_9ZZZZ
MAPRVASAKPAAVATPAPAAPVKTVDAPAAAAKKVAEPKTAKGAAAAKTEKTAPAAVAADKKEDATADAEEVQISLVDKVELKINSLSAIIKETLAELKVLKKDYERMRKSVEKTERKRANARTNPNGFAKPTPIIDELCVFLNVPSGSVMSRTDVTRKINAYIKEHNLNKPENKRIILPNPALRKILNVKEGDEVSFFSLQKFLSPLFKKTVPVAPVATA